MEALYRQYQQLTAGQQKFLCFLAYTGKKTEERLLAVYRKGEDLKAADLKTVVNTLRSFYQTTYYNYRGEYQLHAHHKAPLLLYMLERKSQWIDHFNKFYQLHQSPQANALLLRLKNCIENPSGSTKPRTTVYYDTNVLVPLASDERFLPLMTGLIDINRFVNDVVIFQTENDIADPCNVIGQIASLYYKQMTPIHANELRAIIALYDFFKQGHYDEKVLGRKNLYACILRSTQALYDGDYAEAFTLLTTAIREVNKSRTSQSKGYFYRLLNNYLLVMAYYFNKADEGKKLAALVKKESFMKDSCQKPVTWLCNYFSTGLLPSQRTVKSYLSGESIGGTSQLESYMALLAARFLHIDVEWPANLPSEPNMLFLRHELSPWLQLSEEERQQLERDFGGEPLLTRIRYRQPWELLLEELTPRATSNKSEKQETRQVRVCYILSGFDRVEPREQNRLQSGAWGAGKRMSMDRFKQGTDFMDETDHQIANTAGRWDYDLVLEKVLPMLIGSDRVYTGWHAPFMPVTIDEEKPYLIIERTKTAFHIKSNIGNANLNGTTVYRKDSDTHYTIITMTERQRTYYQKLLSIGNFPLEAEEQLRDFLPKVSDIIEVHSDLVEGGTTLEHCEGSPLLCLQATPEGTAGTYNIWCMAKPLTEGKTLLDPGQGINPCVAEKDGVRYQVTRNIKGERANMELLRTFIDDNNLSDIEADDLFIGRTPVCLNPQGLLQLMEFVRQQPDHFFMEWPEGGKLNLKTAQPGNWNISLRSKSGWFEATFPSTTRQCSPLPNCYA